MAAYGNMDKALPGELVGLTNTHQIDSRLADGAVAFGAVVFGKGDGEQVSTTASGSPLGVAARTALDTYEYKDKDCVNVVRTGKVFCVAGGAITADTEVALNTSTGKIVAKPQSATEGVVNLGWFARSTAEQADDLVIIDLG